MTFDQIKKLGIKTILASLIGFIVVVTAFSSFYILGGTEYAVKRTPGGKLIGIIEPGVHFKTPFLSTVHVYDQFQTVRYEDDDDGDPQTHGTMKRITFADTYGGFIGGTIRYQLPADPTLLVSMHRAYVNESNLIRSGLEPVSKQLLTYTANQITGEEFMQGGQNEYQIRVEDQGNNGLYVTKRQKVKVSKNASDIGINDQNPKKRAQRESFIYRNVIQRDDKGVPKRQALPTTKYGIKIVQLTIDDFKPEPKLNDFINRKKDQIAKRQKLIEEQENERQAAVTAELKGTRERIEAKQKMLREKDAAVIQAQKKVDLEQKEAELQIVRKRKELEIAKANKGIQKATAEAAKFQAVAIKEKGLAEAAVKKANYLAVRKDILELEVEKITQLAKYKALEHTAVTMPTNLFMTNAGEGTSGASLQDLTNLHILEKVK